MANKNKNKNEHFLSQKYLPHRDKMNFPVIHKQWGGSELDFIE